MFQTTNQDMFGDLLEINTNHSAKSGFLCMAVTAKMAWASEKATLQPWRGLSSKTRGNSKYSKLFSTECFLATDVPGASHSVPLFNGHSSGPHPPCPDPLSPDFSRPRGCLDVRDQGDASLNGSPAHLETVRQGV
jgi:hypothetical protein